MKHQAIRNNLGDVSAKDGSQETGIGLIGLIISLIITQLLDDSNKVAIWILLLLFTILNYFQIIYRASLTQLESSREEKQLNSLNYLISKCEEDNYILYYDIQLYSNKLLIFLHKNCNSIDIIKAYFQLNMICLAKYYS